MERQPPRSTGHAAAFTLVELMVVIVVIGVLVALLLPALARARSEARVQTCVSNVRQQGMAVLGYANDQHEALPPRTSRLRMSDGAGGFSDATRQINRFLADYIGEVFPVSDDDPFGTPTGAWRCPDVSIDRDGERSTHQGVLHHAPNGWLFSVLGVNEELGVMDVWCDMLSPWEPRYSHHSWRTLGDVWRPHEIIALMDNVSFYFAPHRHRDARNRYSFSTDAVHNTGDPDLPDNVGSHDDLERRPAVYLDGHGEAVSSAMTYWLGPRRSYGLDPAGPEEVLYEREVQKFLWFVQSGGVLPP